MRVLQLFARQIGQYCEDKWRTHHYTNTTSMLNQDGHLSTNVYKEIVIYHILLHGKLQISHEGALNLHTRRHTRSQGAHIDHLGRNLRDSQWTDATPSREWTSLASHVTPSLRRRWSGIRVSHSTSRGSVDQLFWLGLTSTTKRWLKHRPENWPKSIDPDICNFAYRGEWSKASIEATKHTCLVLTMEALDKDLVAQTWPVGT